ncbi:hypothetical protein T492DRAFT_847238 [Pavlovales sp. CCMP2436]|nr:hypothetical protein T492DRAFT_847238 [Pavlovales sp. CCMP2436]
MYTFRFHNWNYIGLCLGLRCKTDALQFDLFPGLSVKGNEDIQSQSITIVTATTTMQLVGINEVENLVIPSGVATTTPRMLDLSGAKSVLISCESFELDSMDSQKSIGSNTTNLLACIPQTVAYGDILTYKTDAAPFILARRKNLSTIVIELLDENQNAYDTQGLPWSILQKMQFGRFVKHAAGFGARAVPAIQRFGTFAGNILHRGSGIGSKVAQIARSGLNALEKSELSKIPGVGEFIGLGKDASNFIDGASRVAGRIGDVASNVGQSQGLRSLTSQFEKASTARPQQRYA